MFVSMIILMCIFYVVVFGIIYGCPNPLNIFNGVWTDEDFDAVLRKIVSDKNFNYSSSYVTGGGFKVYVGSKYGGFTINGIGGHSFLQKRKFFKAFYKRALEVQNWSK